MAEFDAQFPKQGLDESAPTSKQPPLTSSDAQNVRLKDPVSGRWRGAQRSGLSKHAANVVGAGKVQDGIALNVDNRNLTYTAYGDTAPVVKWSTRLPQSGGPYEVCSDDEGNGYWTDWPKAVSKLNPSGTKLWTITPGLDDNLHEIRAVCTEPSGWVFCGASYGGDQKKAKIFGYQQGNDGTCDFVWEIQIGMYAAQMKVEGGELYVLCEDKAFQRGYVRVYAAPTTAAPILIREWRVSYPTNAFWVNRDSKAVYTAHEPNTSRNFDSASIVSTSWWEDWTPKNLTSSDKRIWCWLDASDLDADGTMNSAYEDGEEILLWSDRSGNSRNAYKNLSIAGFVNTERGPTLRKKATSGRDALRFNGVDQSMCSDDSVSTGGSNITWLNLDRTGQRGFIPMYPGAQFALFMLVHCEPEEAIQVILGQDRGYTHDNATFRGIFTNRGPGKWDAQAASTYTTGAKNAPRIGTIGWYETTTAGDGTGGHGPVYTATQGQLCGFQGGNGTCLISIVHGAGITKSVLRINGRTVDDWTGIDVWKGHDPTFLGTCRGIGTNEALNIVKRFSGLMMELVTLSDWYVQNTNPLVDPTRQTLIELPDFYAGTHNYNPTLGTVTELERMEGYLAHKWGIPHKLPVGTFNALLFAVDNPAATDTVTINGRVYTWSAAPGATPDAVATAANSYLAAVNLHKAINLTGVAGTDYGTGTTINADFTSLGVTEYDNSSAGGFNSVCLAIQGKTTSGTRIAVSSSNTSGGAATQGIWDETTSYANTYATGSIGNTGRNIEHFPHRYYLTKVAAAGDRTLGTAVGSLGGPPRADNKTVTSPYQNLSSPYGMICRWDSTSGKLNWICCSNDNGDATGRGAIGYGVAASSENGLVYCMGPRQAADAVVGASAVDIRCIKDDSDYYSTTTGDGAWTVALTNATTWERPRMDVDDDDNVYIPYFSNEYSYGAFVYTKAGVRLHSITLSNYDLARCIAALPNHPDWGTDLNGTGQNNAPRAEFCYVGARVENIATLTCSSTVGLFGNSVTFTAYVTSPTTITTEAFSFVNALVNPGDVLIAAGDVATTMSRLAAAVNNSGGGGYIALAGGASTLVRAENLTSTSITFRAIAPIQSKPNAYTYDAVTAQDSIGGAPLTWTGRMDYGVTHYLGSVTTCAYKVALVHSVLTTGSPRRLIELAVGANAINTIISGSWAAVSGGTFTSASQYYQSTSLFQKVYFTNGEQIMVVDCKETVLTAIELAATNSGPPPPRCKLLETWRGRLVAARSPDDAHNWHMSAVGDPQDWDNDPAVPTPTQAISGNNSMAGRVPDIINAICPISDDLLLFGCDSSIWRLTGDPMAGGQLDLVTNTTGMSFGRPYCLDSEGVLYFFGSRGGLYAMHPGGKPEKISDAKLPVSLPNINLALYYVKLVWNDTDDCVHMLVMPFANGGTQISHYVYDKNAKGFWRDTYGTASSTIVQPTAAWISDGDGADDRVIVFGCEDGYARRIDASASDDDGQAISSAVLFGPYCVDNGTRARLNSFLTTLATEQRGARISAYTSEASDRPVTRVYDSSISAGMNPWKYVSASGRYFWVRIYSAQVGSRWAYESTRLQVFPAGKAKVYGW